MDYNLDYTYPTPDTTTDPATAAAGFALLGVFLLFLFIVVVISYVVSSFVLGRIFKKAGVPQWIAWVPVYNTWKILELGGQQGFWAILAILPFVNIVSLVFMYIAMYNIGKKLGKEDWFVLLAIFVPLIWMIWLAFDDSKWPGVEKKTVAKKTTAKARK